MILKALTRKVGSGGVVGQQLIRYILRYSLDEQKQINLKGVAKSSGEVPFIIRHNIRSSTLEGFIMEFKQNEKNRIHKRSNQTALNHFIISFSPDDSLHIDDKKLRAIAKKFIQLRGENNLYIGSKHMDKSHIHLHIAGSGTQINGRASRISKKQLADLKKALDAFQMQRFPELTNSLPRHGLSMKQNGLLKHVLPIEQDKRLTQKNAVLKALESAYAKSESLDSFLSELKVQGHEPYYRAGKLTGVKYAGQRKFRLAKLGFQSEKLEQLNAVQNKQTNDLAVLRQLRSRTPKKEQEKEFDGWIRERETNIIKANDEDNSMSKMPSPFSIENEGYGDFPTRRISKTTLVSPG
ncbi:MAG: relaxase/mobilization nuclease domain-containing protein [Patescibacteria group bacterium]